MVQPINYSSDVLNPIQGYLQGLKFGEGLNTDRLNQEATTQSMGIQREQMDLQLRQYEDAQRARAQAQAAARANAAAAQARAVAGRDALLGYLTKLEEGTATPADLRRGIAENPQLADQFQAFASSVSEERLNNELGFGRQLSFALANDNTEAAENLLRTRQEAAQAGGDERAAAGYQAQLLQLQENPKGLLMQTLMPMASTLPTDEFDSFYNDILGLGGDEMTTGFQTLDQRARAAGYEPGSPEYQRFMAEGGPEGQPLVQIIGDEVVDPFTQTLSEAEGAQFVSFLDQGPTARRNIARLDQLEGLLGNVETGFGAAARTRLGEMGIPVEGAGDLQAAQALINSMVPEQRQPGSGPMSDADLALFKQSVPRLINQPGGNAQIIQTMRQINEYDAELARIAQLAAAGEYTRAEAREAVNNMSNPLEDFNTRIDGVTRPEAGEVPSISSDAEYDALPSGATFVDPNGVTRRKP